MESIVNTIKKLVGIDVEDNSYDTDVIIFIRSTMLALTQMGVISLPGFILTSINETWNDYLGTDIRIIDPVTTYLFLKTKLIFDPPSNSTLMKSIENSIAELDFRIPLLVETINSEV